MPQARARRWRTTRAPRLALARFLCHLSRKLLGARPLRDTFDTAATLFAPVSTPAPGVYVSNVRGPNGEVCLIPVGADGRLAPMGPVLVGQLRELPDAIDAMHDALAPADQGGSGGLRLPRLGWSVVGLGLGLAAGAA